MIIVNLTGGLGNQMFQYAFGREIATKNGTNLKLHFTNALFNTQREYELDVFNISAIPASPKDLKKLGIVQNRVFNRFLYLFDERYKIQFNKHIATQRYPYGFNPSYASTKNDSYIQGYWADERYFKDIENILRKEFTPKKSLDERNKKILRQIQTSTSVSLHVRRTDYVTNKANIPQFLGVDYYRNSIKKIEALVRDPVYFVFSDDIPWCRENLKQITNKAQFIDHNKGREAYKDMLLMSECKHNIIANSTFSWWGGWLN
jgi:hypothetical protein